MKLLNLLVNLALAMNNKCPDTTLTKYEKVCRKCERLLIHRHGYPAYQLEACHRLIYHHQCCDSLFESSGLIWD